jgi:hypothetical protein
MSFSALKVTATAPEPQLLTDRWRWQTNTLRPHSALQKLQYELNRPFSCSNGIMALNDPKKTCAARVQAAPPWPPPPNPSMLALPDCWSRMTSWKELW